jgi:two-component system, LytTR family, sensor kinase
VYTKLPFKRLNRLNWMLAFLVSIAVGIFLAQNPKEHHKLINMLQSIICIALIGYLDVWVISLLAKRIRFKIPKFTFYRLLITYPASISIYLLSWPLFAWLQKYQLSVQGVEQLIILTLGGIIINTVVIVLHDGVLLYEYRLQAELELSQLRSTNAEAANLLLKQQIHPHFLFNSLNTVKALYHQDTDVADNYIVHLANFLRASIGSQTANIVRLDDEIAFLKDYLAMQQIRFGKALVCSIELPAEILKQYYVPSFSLQPLLENALKHNEFTHNKPLHVRIFYNEGWITMVNNVQKKNLKIDSTGYGLANLAERYRLYSGDAVVIKDDGREFSVSIKLLSHEYSNY